MVEYYVAQARYVLHVSRYLVERDLFSIVFDWLALLDARSLSLFRRYCVRDGVSPPRTPTSLTLYFLRFLRDQDNLYLLTSSSLFWDLRPLWYRPHQSKPAQLTHTSLPASGAAAVPDGCALHAVLILRVLLVPDVYTHVSTAVRVVSIC